MIGWAQKAAEDAEQLYKTSEIEEAQRKDEATRLVYEFIAAAGWAVDRVLKIAKPLMEGEAVQAALIARGYLAARSAQAAYMSATRPMSCGAFRPQTVFIVDGRAGRFTVAALGGAWNR